MLGSVGYSIVLRSRANRLVLAIVMAMSPTCAAASSMAPASARESSQDLLTEGDAAVELGDFDVAISKYRASYYRLSKADRASYLGSIPVRKAMAAFEQGVAEERDPAKRRQLLEDQRVLLAQFLLEVRARDGAAEEIGADLIAELEAIQRANDEALEAEGHSADPSSADSPPVPVVAPLATKETRALPSDEPPASPRDPIGLGLIIGGSALLATGLGVSVGWWTVRIGARAKVDGGGERFAEGTQSRADYLDTAHEKARKFLIAGPVIAGIGLATTLAGVAHLVVHRRRSTRDMALHVTPFSSSTAGGLVLHGRF
jgi:hypothetical protein